MNMLLKNGEVISSSGRVKTDVRIKQGKIAALGENLLPLSDERVLDATGCYLLPGLIDAHTHFDLISRGGNRTADDFYTGGLSALYGGVTTVVDFADPLPGKTVAEAVGERASMAKGKSFVDYAFHFVIDNYFNLEDMAQLPLAGITAVKVFTTYREAGYYLPDEKLYQVLKKAKELNLLVTVHGEDDDLIASAQQTLSEQGELLPSLHGASRPAEAEIKAVEKLLAFNKGIGASLYFVHVTTARSCMAIAEARMERQAVWGETCPHYLLLNSQCYERKDGRKYIMTPPLRHPNDSQALWEGLKWGYLSVVASDHCAYTLEQKEKGKTCQEVLPGIPGTDFLLYALYGRTIGRKAHRTTGKQQPETISLGLEKIIELLSENPAALFGLSGRKGRIAPGMDGDVVIFDPKTRWIFRQEDLHSKAGYSPFEGLEVFGKIKGTVRQGKLMMWEGTLMGEPDGEFLHGQSE